MGWEEIVREFYAIRSHEPQYDIDGDGRVTFRDLIIVIEQYGRRCHR